MGHPGDCCGEDDDCDNRRCVRDRCRAGNAGDPCEHDSDCSTFTCGRGVCTNGGPNDLCGHDGDCKNQRCVNDRCRAGATGDPCGFDTDCENNTCVNDKCEGRGYGDGCNRDGDCDNRICSHEICVGGNAPGPALSDSADGMVRNVQYHDEFIPVHPLFINSNEQLPIKCTKVPYNEIIQKSSHNSYEDKPSITDQLQNYYIRSLELDIWDHKLLLSDVEGDWFVYHAPVVATKTSCNMLSECLGELKAWSDANPRHEPVTVWIDLKTRLKSRNRMDERLTASGLDIYTPYEFLDGHATLKQAASHGWPTERSLRGKFIFIFSDKSYSYCSTDETCNHEQRKAFRHCEAPASEGFCVFFNQNIDETKIETFKQLHESGYTTRAYYVNDNHTWRYALFNRVNHIATDEIDFKKHPWARTHNKFGGPFQYINHESKTPPQYETQALEQITIGPKMTMNMRLREERRRMRSWFKLS